MQIICVTSILLLAVLGFMLGRSSLVNDRLRREIHNQRISINNLTETEEELRETIEFVQSRQRLYLTRFVREDMGGWFLVSIIIQPDSNRYIKIPIKDFFDADSPESARNEADEFMYYCER